MRKIYSVIVAFLCVGVLHAQILSPDGGDVIGIGLGTMTAAEAIPVDEVIDTWEPPVLTGDRSVVWVHGLGGHGDYTATDATNSWITASSESELNYQLQSRRPDYSDTDLDYAALQLRTIMEDYTLSVDPYIIAHSQGGIVSRQMDKLIEENGWERTVQGVVTFGTPHQGAMILNNRDDLQQLLLSMCNAMIQGPALEWISESTFLSLLNMFIGVDDEFDEACSLLVEDFLPFVFDLDAYYAGVTEGYYVGSPELDELNDYDPGIPYVAFWGEETDPVMWNTLVHVLPGREPNSELYGAFGANNDTYLTDNFNVLKDHYNTMYLTNLELSGTWGDFFKDFFFSLFPGDYISTYDKAMAWKAGRDWLLDANSEWEIIIGAREYVWDETTSCLCVEIYDGWTTWYDEDDLEGYTCSEIEYLYEPFSDCNEIIDLELVDVIMKVNDGVVLKESAMEPNNKVSSKHMTGSNHFSMRNDGETEARLEELFAGEHGEFFIIDLRD